MAHYRRTVLRHREAVNMSQSGKKKTDIEDPKTLRPGDGAQLHLAN